MTNSTIAALTKARDVIADMRRSEYGDHDYETIAGPNFGGSVAEARTWDETVKLLNAELARLAEPKEGDMFWPADDPEYSRNHLSELMDDYGVAEIVEVQTAVRLTDFWAVRMEWSDDQDFETKTFATREEAESWVALVRDQSNDEG